MRRKLIRSVAMSFAAAVLASLSLVAVAGPAAAVPDVDPYPTVTAVNTCYGGNRPGTADFRTMINQRIGGTGNIYDCKYIDGTSTLSDHADGRAFDWMMSVSNSAEAAKVDTVLHWLTRTDENGKTHAMARRLGITYIIWNHRIINISSPSSGWQPYSGTSNPHTNHVHFSFSLKGADRQTSWFTTNPKPASWYPDVNAAVQSSGSVVYNGVLYKFGRGADNTVKYWFASGGPWSGVQTFGSGIAGDPAATVHNGTLFVFAIGSDGTVKYWFANGGAWSGVQTIGAPGTVSGDISATVYNGVLYVFARGIDGTIKYYFAAGGPWSGVQTFGGSVGGAVSTAIFNGVLYVFAVGTDGSVKYWFATGGPWSDMQTVGSSASGGLSSTVYNGVLYVFARGGDGQMRYWFATGGPWSGVQVIGGSIAGGVSSVVYNGVLYAFGRGTDGTVKYWFASGGPWSGVQTFGGGLI